MNEEEQGIFTRAEAEAILAAARKAAEILAEEVRRINEALAALISETVAPVLEKLRENISKCVEDYAGAECTAQRKQNRPPKNLMHRWTAPARRIVPCARRGC